MATRKSGQDLVPRLSSGSIHTWGSFEKRRPSVLFPCGSRCKLLRRGFYRKASDQSGLSTEVIAVRANRFV